MRRPEPPTRAHYVVRVGNDGLARKITSSSPNHWHFLSPQLIWGLPKATPHVRVRDQFESDIRQSPTVPVYIWFLCNGHNGPGHFVNVGIGRRHTGNGPVKMGPLTIPDDMMSRLNEGFDHWFDWWPLNTDPGFEERVRAVPIPHPPYISTLRRVTAEHPSLETFESFVDREVERQQREQRVQPQVPQGPQRPQQSARADPSSVIQQRPRPKFEIQEADLANVRREYVDPHASGFIYLIHMADTSFYKIGMSLDPQVRLQTLQTGNPHLLTLVDTRTVSDMRNAELSMHQRFEERRVENRLVREWFEFNADGDEVARVKEAFAEVAC